MLVGWNFMDFISFLLPFLFFFFHFSLLYMRTLQLVFAYLLVVCCDLVEWFIVAFEEEKKKKHQNTFACPGRCSKNLAVNSVSICDFTHIPSYVSYTIPYHIRIHTLSFYKTANVCTF